VFAAQADQRLLIDLDDSAQLELLRGLIGSPKDDAAVTLQEPLPGLASAWLPGPQGRYLVELAVPVARRGESGSASQRRRPPATMAPPPSRAERVRAPGSDWLYVKLYASGIVSEPLIGQALRAFADDALADGLAVDWFFVRLRDPRPHVRVRFRGEPTLLTTKLAPRLFAWAGSLVEENACTSFVVDTYLREVERYGGRSGIVVAESVFGVDSRLAADLIHLELSSLIAVDRELLCVLTLDRLLFGLGLDDAARQSWCGERVSSRHEVASEWREQKQLLRALLGKPAEAVGGQPLARLLEAFVSDLAPHAGELSARHSSGEIAWPPEAEMMASFAHMHCNRLLGVDRGAEARTMGLLLRTLESLSRAPI
jgi:thiopeptide-type bacteriocin biosynthesis protein